MGVRTKCESRLQNAESTARLVLQATPTPITRRLGSQSAWCQRRAGPYHPTPVVYGDYLYVLYDRGMLSCFEAKTGKPVYEKKKLDAGSTAQTTALGIVADPADEGLSTRKE